MNSEEFEKLCDELRAQYSVIAKKEHPDASDDEIDDMCNAAIMSELWDMFKDDKIDKDDLIKMAGQLGFEPAGDLAEGPAKVDATQTIEGDDGKELELSKEAIEEAQGYDDDGKDDGYVKEDEDTDESDDDGKDTDDEDEDKERKEARKLYGFDD